MNPPYQMGGRKQGGVCASHTLWDKFVFLSKDIMADGGYVCAVHPSLWRKPGHEIQEIILDNDLKYLEIHHEKDGMKTFGKETRYDWYILKKSPPNGETIIKDQDGKINKINLAKWDFIPNCEFDLIDKLLAKAGDEKVEILCDSSYHTQRIDRISATKTNKFKYPCVYTVSKESGPRLFWSSDNNRGHFGIPKVIWSTFRPISVGFFLDKDGEYGLTQFSSAIVDDHKILPDIQKALDSEQFRRFCSAISMGKLEVNTGVIRLFRKDFWKAFI